MDHPIQPILIIPPVAYLGGQLGHGLPLGKKIVCFAIGKNRNTWNIWAPCVSSSGQQNLAPSPVWNPKYDHCIPLHSSITISQEVMVLECQQEN